MDRHVRLMVDFGSKIFLEFQFVGQDLNHVRLFPEIDEKL